MSRYFLTLEYDGAGFCGWQRQANGLAVQEVLEQAVHAFTREAVTAHAAGRTDAGVHALAMVAHVDLARPHPANTVRNALNHHLRPHPVAVIEARAVGHELHARFSAERRHYLYRIRNRRAPLALDLHRVWLVARDLDAELMHAAGQALVGRHDFTSFRAAECQASSPVKTLDRLLVERSGDEVRLTVTARSFLHHQVRNIVGSLVLVGKGDWRVGDVAKALAAKDRAAAGPTAPAAGLYFAGVDYPGFTTWRDAAPRG
ncbi:MAG: tRNA pseudouridine(38-40) synthase TruA [Geminicoccaceae bacterium]|nr:MAG: tRNA pseudouridine(38-40) synthase TruA [Geminicoccaceae bacterium]